MEEVIKIRGGKKLTGTIRVSGAKNDTVAIIPASVLASKPVTIAGIPDISDVVSLKEILRYLDVKITDISADEIIVDPSNMQNKVLDIDAVGKLRASYYFMGALLGKYHYCKIRMPGGCNLGPRPIDLHLKGFEALGATITDDGEFITLEAKKLVGANIYLDFASVGATINLLMAAVLAEGKTEIENAAREPEIIDCITLLNNLGAKIHGGGTSKITIYGVKHLGGCFHEIIPDRIEAGTYIILSAAMADQVRIENVITHHVESLLSKLEEMGVNLDVGIDYIDAYGSKDLNPCRIITKPYPGFATDLQAPLVAFLTQCNGDSNITETIYPERFKACLELNKMGANIDVNVPDAVVHGPTKLVGCDVNATDLRCGAALVIAGILAEGVTTIHDIYHIDRGYQDIVSKLQAIGVDIWREKI